MSDPSKLYATDETFRQVADLLFGGGGDELIAKFSPTQSDVSTPGKTNAKRKAALTGNTVAAVGGAHALGVSTRDLARVVQGKKAAGHGAKDSSYITSKFPRLKPIESALKSPKSKVAAAGVAAGWVGLHGAELATDAVSRKAIKQQYPKQKVAKGVSLPKAYRAMKQTAVNTEALTRQSAWAAHEAGKTARTLRRVTGAGAAGVGAGLAAGGAAVGYKAGKKNATLKPIKPKTIQKSAPTAEEYSVTWEGEFSKVDSDKRQVFGWASIVEMNGEPVVDLQGDYISIDEVEKAGYEYVVKSRVGGNQHREGFHASDMIESFIVTPEKKEKLGLPDEMPLGWWVGYRVNDDATWQQVKNGERLGFSIHGRGKRSESNG